MADAVLVEDCVPNRRGDHAGDLCCAGDVTQLPDHVPAGLVGGADSRRGGHGERSASAAVNIVHVAEGGCDVAQVRWQRIGYGQELVQAVFVGQGSRDGEDERATNGIGLYRWCLGKLSQQGGVRDIAGGGVDAARAAVAGHFNSIRVDAAGQHCGRDHGRPHVTHGQGDARRPGDRAGRRHRCVGPA